eukprot:TRINITY_DN2368_c0_g1_i4.p1 TRINITY_DN2368_c0_g1~~TRINITY_DN2368_c0_g1_i4.p1  ORF type:complete len:339 (+),score=76.50 TRINITY_DN2368_c0_g1_i4:247-1263(+)
MRSTYMNYIPQEDIEYRLDLKWKQSRQQQLADKNSQEEMNELISRWGNDKAILQDEIYRKAISMDTQSQFDQCAFNRKNGGVKRAEKILGNKVVNEIINYYQLDKKKFIDQNQEIKFQVDGVDEDDEESSYEDDDDDSEEEEEEEVEEQEEQNKMKEYKEEEQQEEDVDIKDDNTMKEKSEYEEYSSSESEQKSEKQAEPKQQIQQKNSQSKRPQSSLILRDFSRNPPQIQRQLPSILEKYSVDQMEHKMNLQKLYHGRLLNQKALNTQVDYFARLTQTPTNAVLTQQQQQKQQQQQQQVADSDKKRQKGYKAIIIIIIIDCKSLKYFISQLRARQSK